LINIGKAMAKKKKKKKKKAASLQEYKRPRLGTIPRRAFLFPAAACRWSVFPGNDFAPRSRRTIVQSCILPCGWQCTVDHNNFDTLVLLLGPKAQYIHPQSF
jgi:hypothetical protein